MKKTITAAMVMVLGLSGCASDGGSTTVGQHGTDSTLSDNKLEGLYLFKIETNMNHLNITSRGDVKVAL